MLSWVGDAHAGKRETTTVHVVRRGWVCDCLGEEEAIQGPCRRREQVDSWVWEGCLAGEKGAPYVKICWEKRASSWFASLLEGLPHVRTGPHAFGSGPGFVLNVGLKMGLTLGDNWVQLGLGLGPSRINKNKKE